MSVSRRTFYVLVALGNHLVMGLDKELEVLYSRHRKCIQAFFFLFLSVFHAFFTFFFAMEVFAKYHRTCWAPPDSTVGNTDRIMVTDFYYVMFYWGFWSNAGAFFSFFFALVMPLPFPTTNPCFAFFVYTFRQLGFLFEFSLIPLYIMIPVIRFTYWGRYCAGEFLTELDSPKHYLVR